MANYLVTDTELTSVANAIRTKGGTESLLEFPSEFVSAIAAIPTGGSSDFSTATVTINLTGNDAIYSSAFAFVSEDELMVGASGSLPQTQYDIVLYKGQFVAYFDAIYEESFYPSEAISVTGNASVGNDGDVTITGNCTITLDYTKIEPL